MSIDVTPQLEERYELAKRQPVLPDDAESNVYLFVPGFMAERFSKPMAPNLAALRAYGLDARLADIDTGASVEENARALSDLIVAIAARTGKKVVPIVHSSGAPELHEALIRHPQLTALIRCAIALNGTFGGTPLAQLFLKLPGLLRRALSVLLKRWGIDSRAIEDVAVEHRQAYQREHPYPDAVLTLSVATRFRAGFSLLRPLIWFLRSRSPGGLSDGVVPTAHQHLSGHLVAFLERADHSDTVMRRWGSRHDPGALTLASVALALAEVTARDAKSTAAA